MKNKSKRISVRMPLRLYNMIEQLSLLFEWNQSAALIHILKAYEFSPDHKAQLLKIGRMRFLTWFRQANIDAKLNEYTPEEMMEALESLKKK